MTSLTTMFIVGKDEYVEFNESMGSKAFLEHIWDQTQTPLDSRDVDTGHLHSAGARISPTPPPRIEFPTVYRVKGKGNTYRSSGKYISWDELARLNPLAVKPPPSLKEFQARGGQVGSGPRLRPGELLRRDEPIAKIKKQASLVRQQASEGAANTYSEEDGWIGGSSASIYATTKQDPSPVVVKKQQQQRSTAPREPETPERKSKTSSSASTKSKSLLERLGIDEATTPPPKSADSSHLRTTPSPGIRRPGAKIPSPLPLTSPARNNGPLSPGCTQTPLSATHPVPETPLKLSHRGGPQTPATPHRPLYVQSSMTEEDAARASGLGLGLTPHKPTIPLAYLGSPEARHGLLQDVSASSALGSDASPSHLPRLSATASTSTSSTAGSQIEAMLERLRKARTGLGTEASMWAPKNAASSAAQSSTQAATSRKSRSGATGIAAASDKLSSAIGSGRNGEASSAGRRRPGHRHNGLQLSLGQGIEVMQNLDEKAEDDLFGSSGRPNPSSVRADGENAVDAWLGSVVPPTPALGAGSPQFDIIANGNGQGSSGFWGAVTSSPEAPRASLLPSQPPSTAGSPDGSKAEAQEVWSGDDDDGEEGRSKAPAQPRFGASDRSARLSAERGQKTSKTPSPSYSQLGAFGAQVSAKLSPSPSALSASRSKDNSRSPSARLSPNLTPSPLEDSDGDADAEDDADRTSRSSRRPKSLSCGRSQQRGSAAAKECTPESGRPNKSRKDASEKKFGRRFSPTKGAMPRDLGDATSSDYKHTEVLAGASTAASSESASGAGHTDEKPRPALEDAFAGLGLDPAQSFMATGTSQEQKGDENEAAPDGANGLSFTKELALAAEATHLPSEAAAKVPEASNIKGTPAGSIDPADAKSAVTALAEDEDSQPVNASASTCDAAAEENAVDTVPAAADEPLGSAEKGLARSESGFDWAADDNEVDDSLPDLDDWGVTIPATPSTKSMFSELAPAATPIRANQKLRQRSAADRNQSASDGRGTGRRKGDRSTSVDQRSAQEPGLVGIRIAGRAASAMVAAPSETHDASRALRAETTEGSKHSMHTPAAKAQVTPPRNEAPPAATPYGRWKTNGAAAANQGAQRTPQPASNSPEDTGIAIKGNGRQRAPPVSPFEPTSAQRQSEGARQSSAARSHPPAAASESAGRRDRLTVRPRVAADSDAFARLISTVSANAVAKGHAGAGATASMHAPHNVSDGTTTSAAAPAPSPAAKIPVRLPGVPAKVAAEPRGKASIGEPADAVKSPKMAAAANGFEAPPHSRRWTSGAPRSASGGGGRSGRGGGGGGGGGGRKRR
ncbi:hypothetical protein ACQY0O_006694 [Thecaphora frezii]